MRYPSAEIVARNQMIIKMVQDRTTTQDIAKVFAMTINAVHMVLCKANVPSYIPPVEKSTGKVCSMCPPELGAQPRENFYYSTGHYTANCKPHHRQRMKERDRLKPRKNFTRFVEPCGWGGCDRLSRGPQWDGTICEACKAKLKSFFHENIDMSPQRVDGLNLSPPIEGAKHHGKKERRPT